MNMKGFRWLTIAFLLITMSLTSIFAAGQKDLKVEGSGVMKLRIQAQDPGTSFYSYATTISRFLEREFPAGSQIEVIPRGGSMSNPTVLNQGDAEVAFGLSYTTALAYLGDPEVYAGRGPHENIRGITGGMHMSYTFIMARREYVERTGFTTLEQMLTANEIPRIGMKPQGSVVLPIADTIFKTLGTSLSEIRGKNRLVQGQPSDISEMLRDKRVDVYIDNVPYNHAGVTEVTLTNDLVFIPIPDKAIQALVANGMSKELVPPGTYKGLTYEYATPATGMVIMANKNAPEEVIYLFTKTLVENRDELVKENAALSHWDPKRGMQQEYAAVPLHDGAKRYYQERGWY